jgi:hypothetical protein
MKDKQYEAILKALDKAYFKRYKVPMHMTTLEILTDAVVERLSKLKSKPKEKK